MRRKSRLPLLGLVMMVKDGAEHLEFCLDSLLPLIGTWTVCDTGSTDDTTKIVEDKLGHLPGRLWHHKWHDYGYNRTLALARAKDTAEWLLMLDSDMTLETEDDFAAFLKAQHELVHGLYVPIFDHGLGYKLPLLVRGNLKWRYSFPTHEYLEHEDRNFGSAMHVLIHHYGNKTGEDLERDLQLLGPLFRKRNPRAVFYVAQTHRFSGNHEAAIAAYELRTQLNGSEEERWYASYQIARLRGDIEGLFEAWRQRPWRHEPLTAAAKIIGQAPAAFIDQLFLEQPI